MFTLHSITGCPKINSTCDVSPQSSLAQPNASYPLLRGLLSWPGIYLQRTVSLINQDRDMWPPLCLQKLWLAQYQCQTPVYPDQDLSTWGQCQHVTCQLTRVTCLTAEPSLVPRITMRLSRRYHHLLISRLPVQCTSQGPQWTTATPTTRCWVTWSHWSQWSHCWYQAG